MLLPGNWCLHKKTLNIKEVVEFDIDIMMSGLSLTSAHQNNKCFTQCSLHINLVTLLRSLSISVTQRAIYCHGIMMKKSHFTKMEDTPHKC